ncbi:MAG: hypothetical protein KDJ22_04370 [Candidatus Competibacteraceae bacterium]|nr:hypothetical protein [Candidatus Competibacteraceae bacterium]MCP5124421.1 hypothetical protein [Gammaproteobacteria bacterium]HRX71702.1 hypothetical protein [Candidatus Competibacteraceae bacterium]
MRAFILPILLLIMLPVIAAAPLTFEEADTDGDGLISADEAADVEGLDFNTADSDNDGTLTVDEYDIALEKMSKSTRSTLPNPAAQSIPPPSSSKP